MAPLPPGAAEEIRAFLDTLRAAGVTSYAGPLPYVPKPVRLALEPLPAPRPSNPKPADTGTQLVEIEGIGLVDRDLFAHEG